MTDRKPHGYWKNRHNIDQALTKLTHQLGHFPSQQELTKAGYSGLLDALPHHGGLSTIRADLGYQETIKPRGYWKNLTTCLTEAKKLIAETNAAKLPTLTHLTQLGHSSLAAAIIKYHGGFTNFRKLLGETPDKETYGSWKSLNFALHQARAVMTQHGLTTLPCAEKLRELGHSSLSNAIEIYHGGYRTFRKLLHQPSHKRENGLLDDLSYIIEQLRTIQQHHHLTELPNGETLRKLGYSSITFAVHKYHGGFHNLRKLLGLPKTRRDPNTWKNLEYALQEAQSVLQRHNLQALPSHEKLIALGHSSLTRAIGKYHGGYTTFRRALHQRLGLPTEKEQLEKILDEYLRP